MARNLLVSTLILFSACAASVSWDDQFDLGIGDSVQTPTARIQFVQVIRDTRCPPWADCISDEQVELLLRVKLGHFVSDQILQGVLIPAGEHPRFPVVELADGSWLTLIGMTFDQDDPVATLLIHGPPQM